MSGLVARIADVVVYAASAYVGWQLRALYVRTRQQWNAMSPDQQAREDTRARWVLRSTWWGRLLLAGERLIRRRSR